MLASAFLGQTISTEDHGDWLLQDVLGEGYFSAVYDAVQVNGNAAASGNTPVALKLLHPSATKHPQFVLEFHTESELLSHLLEANNVVTMLHGSVSGTLPMQLPNAVSVDIPVQFHVFERADGCLDDVVIVHDLADWSLRLDLLRDVVAGIHQMHIAGIVHRDVKSSNVLLFTENGCSAGQGRVADLGRSAWALATPRFSPETYTFGRGDMSFAAPELVLGGGDATGLSARLSDLYLLGSVLCELAVGQGATSLILPDWQGAQQRILSVPEAARAQARRTELNRLHIRVATTAGLIADAAPPVIASDLAHLFRQLCDPHPDQRNRRHRRDRNLPATDLAWLLRRVDILRRRLKIHNKAIALRRTPTA